MEKSNSAFRRIAWLTAPLGGAMAGCVTVLLAWLLLPASGVVAIVGLLFSLLLGLAIAQSMRGRSAWSSSALEATLQLAGDREVFDRYQRLSDSLLRISRQAKELAGHSDIKMTMKYTHIVIGDQAKAVGNLSVPKAPPKPAAGAAPAEKAALHGRCISGGVGRLSLASAGNGASPKKRQNPCVGKGLDAVRRQLSPTGKVEAAGIECESPSYRKSIYATVYQGVHFDRSRSGVFFRRQQTLGDNH